MSSDPGWDCLRAAAGFRKQLFVVDGVVEERARRSAQRHRQRRQQRRSWRRRSVVHRSCATFKLPRRRRKTYRRYFGEPAQTKKFTFGNVYASVLKCLLGCDFGYVLSCDFRGPFLSSSCGTVVRAVCSGIREPLFKSCRTCWQHPHWDARLRSTSLIYQGSSVNRLLPPFNIWPFTTIQICPVCQRMFKINPQNMKIV